MACMEGRSLVAEGVPLFPVYYSIGRFISANGKRCAHVKRWFYTNLDEIRSLHPKAKLRVLTIF